MPGEHEQDDRPRSMCDAEVRRRRRAMLCEPHIAPLTAYAAGLREHGSVEVPEFDPLDGGVRAQILFLFEKPGPMTSAGGGSGFISRNNDDPTAEATFDFMRRAGIPRGLTLTWNVVPWWNGTRKVTGRELREGAGRVRDLVALLPQLRAVVLVGRRAARAEVHLRRAGLALFSSAHPSPLVRARFPQRWNAIPSQWEQAFQATQAQAADRKMPEMWRASF